jgi:hypothetical protein
MNTPSSSAATVGLSGYHSMIREATGAPSHLLGLLENIMRQEVFYSTLDWQTRAEFDRGAKRAYTLYRRDSAFYDAHFSLRAATFQLMRAEAELAQAQSSGVEAEIAAATSRVEAARADLAAAQLAVDRISNR